MAVVAMYRDEMDIRKEVKLSLKKRNGTLGELEVYDYIKAKRYHLSTIIGDRLHIDSVNMYLEKCSISEMRVVVRLCDIIGLPLNSKTLSILTHKFEVRMKECMEELGYYKNSDAGFIINKVMSVILGAECVMISILKSMSGIKEGLPKFLVAARSTFDSFCKTIHSASSVVSTTCSEVGTILNTFSANADMYASTIATLL